MGNGVPGSSVGEKTGLPAQNVIQPRLREELALLADDSQMLSVLGKSVLADVPERVQASIGEMINGQGRTDVFLLPFLLGNEGGVGRRKSKGLQAVLTGLVSLYVGEFLHRPRLQVDDGQRVLGQLVSLFLGDFGLPGILEGCLDQADGEGFVIQEGNMVPAGDFDGAFALFTVDAEGKYAVSLLRVHFVGDDMAIRRDGCCADALPGVIDTVVQRFFLGLKGQGRQDEEQREDFFHKIRE